MQNNFVKLLLTYGSAQGLLGGLSFVIIVILARLFSLGDFAIFTWIIAIAGFYNAFTSSWIGSVIIRFPPSQHENALNFYVKLFILINAFGGLGIYFLLVIFNTVPEVLIFFTVLLCISLSVFNFLSALIRSSEVHAIYVIFHFARYLCFIFPTLFLWYLNITELYYFIFLLIVSYFLPVMVVGKRVVILCKDDPSSKNSELQSIELYSYGLPVLINGILILSFPFITKYFLLKNGDYEAFSLFSGNFDLTEKIFSMINIAWSVGINPLLFKLQNQDSKNIKNLLSVSFTTYLVVICPLLLIVFQFSPQISNIFLGKSFGGGSDFMFYGALNAALIGLVHRYSIVLSMFKKTNLIFLCLIPAFIFFSAANLLSANNILNWHISINLILSNCVWLFCCFIMSRKFTIYNLDATDWLLIFSIILLNFVWIKINIILFQQQASTALVLSLLFYFILLAIYFWKKRGVFNFT